MRDTAYNMCRRGCASGNRGTKSRKEMGEMTAAEYIKKYGLKLGEKDGVKGVIVTVKATPAAVEKMKAMKNEIMAVLTAAKAAEETARAEKERADAEYLRTADLRRCLVAFSKEYSVEWYIETLEYADGEFHSPKVLIKRIHLYRVTATMERLMEEHVSFGFCAVAREITAEEEAAILAEQKAPEPEKVPEKKKPSREEIREARIAEAVRTGLPVEIFRTMAPCSDPREECSADLVVETAMPDGTVRTTRQHTW